MAFQPVPRHKICCLHYEGCLTIKRDRKSLLCMTVKMYTKHLPICLSGCMWVYVCGSSASASTNMTHLHYICFYTFFFLVPLSPPAKWDINKRTLTVIHKCIIIVGSSFGPVELHHPFFRALMETGIRTDAAPALSASPRWWIIIRHTIKRRSQIAQGILLPQTFIVIFYRILTVVL